MDQLRNRHFFIIDSLFLGIAVYVSYVMRLERLNIDGHWVSCILFGLTAIIVTTLAFRFTGVYSRYWRYASIDELLLLVGTLTVATITTSVISAFILFFLQLNSYPRSIPFIFLLTALGVAATPRLVARFASQQYRQRLARPLKRVLIVGAGDAGAMVVRQMQNSSRLNYEIVGIVDDDYAKQGMQIHGASIIGNRRDIPQIVRANRVQEVIIAIPSASGKVVREILNICETTGAKTKIIPSLAELIDGTVHVNQLREVQIEDLLRREPIHTDFEAVRSLIGQKRVLVTGGGGSIGGELCRQIVRAQPAELILVGHGENSIFEIYHELRETIESGIRLSAVIGDVRFPERIKQIFREFEPEIVFHAAAHKHVPLMEANPAEAITNNVLGTKNLLAAAVESQVERFVMISTDKAVNPTSVMGASKRAAELLVHYAAHAGDKPYVAVRFGNVLGSRGSVVLTFQKQIKMGGPVTVTHPDVVRYFMTIPEAVQLVLQAAVMGSGGELFMLDMGSPIKIADLAHDVIELSGLEVGEDIEIVYSGLRPGEKLYEEMFVAGEDYQKTAHEKVFIAGNASAFVPDDLVSHIELLEQAADLDDRDAIIERLQALIPEYQPDGYRFKPEETFDAASDSIGKPI